MPEDSDDDEEGEDPDTMDNGRFKASESVSSEGALSVVGGSIAIVLLVDAVMFVPLLFSLEKLLLGVVVFVLVRDEAYSVSPRMERLKNVVSSDNSSSSSMYGSPNGSSSSSSMHESNSREKYLSNRAGEYPLPYP